LGETASPEESRSGAILGARKRYNVLFIAPTSFFSDYGHPVRILEEVLALQKRGHRVTIVTYYNGRDIAGLPIERTLPIPWRQHYEVGSSRHKIAFDVLLALKSLTVGLRLRPDVIHAHNMHYFSEIHARSLERLAKARRIPLILTAHNTWDDILFLELTHKIDWNHIIAVSHFIKREIIKYALIFHNHSIKIRHILVIDIKK